MRSLYGLRQSGRNWYRRLREFLLKNGFKTADLCPYIFIRMKNTQLVIVASYVDDLNIIGTPNAIMETKELFAKEFERKDLGETSFCLSLQITHINNGLFVHQSTYINTILEKFNMDKCHPIKAPLIVRKLQIENDEYGPPREGEEILPKSYPYQEAIGTLMYLVNCTRPDLCFAVNLLSRYNKNPTMRHWKGIKQILRYLKGTSDVGLYYSISDEKMNYMKNSIQKLQNYKGNPDQLFKNILADLWYKTDLTGYADAGFHSDPGDNGKSQTGYCFLRCGAAISWRSQKQKVVATSACHSEIIALHEATRQCNALHMLENTIASLIDVKLKDKLIVVKESGWEGKGERCEPKEE